MSIIYYSSVTDFMGHTYGRDKSQAQQIFFAAAYYTYEIIKFFKEKGSNDYTIVTLSDHGGQKYKYEDYICIHGCNIKGNEAFLNIYNPKVSEFAKKMNLPLASRKKETWLSRTDELPSIIQYVKGLNIPLFAVGTPSPIFDHALRKKEHQLITFLTKFNLKTHKTFNQITKIEEIFLKLDFNNWNTFTTNPSLVNSYKHYIQQLQKFVEEQRKSLTRKKYFEVNVIIFILIVACRTFPCTMYKTLSEKFKSNTIFIIIFAIIFFLDEIVIFTQFNRNEIGLKSLMLKINWIFLFIMWVVIPIPLIKYYLQKQKSKQYKLVNQVELQDFNKIKFNELITTERVEKQRKEEGREQEVREQEEIDEETLILQNNDDENQDLVQQEFDLDLDLDEQLESVESNENNKKKQEQSQQDNGKMFIYFFLILIILTIEAITSQIDVYYYIYSWMIQDRYTSHRTLDQFNYPIMIFWICVYLFKEKRRSQRWLNMPLNTLYGIIYTVLLFLMFLFDFDHVITEGHLIPYQYWSNRIIYLGLPFTIFTSLLSDSFWKYDSQITRMEIYQGRKQSVLIPILLFYFYIMDPAERILFITFTMTKMCIIDTLYEESTQKNQKNIYFFIMTVFLVKSIDFTWLYNGGHYRFDGDLFAGFKGIFGDKTMVNQLKIKELLPDSLFGLHKARIFAIFAVFSGGYAKAIGKIKFYFFYFFEDYEIYTPFFMMKLLLAQLLYLWRINTSFPSILCGLLLWNLSRIAYLLMLIVVGSLFAKFSEKYKKESSLNEDTFQQRSENIYI